MQNNKVSVIFSFYNDAKYLNESIHSILNQSYSNLELIMIDNGSTDNSFDIANSYQEKDKRIKIIRSKTNYYGGGVNYRKLLKEVSGEYIKVFCADDVMMPNCLEIQVNFLEQNKKFIACFAGMSKIDNYGHEIKGDSLLCVAKKDRYEYLNHIFYNYNAFTFPTFMIKTEFLDETMMDLRLLHFFDVKMWIETLKKGEIGVIKEDLVQYRIRKDQISHTHRCQTKIKTYLFELHLIYEEFFKINDFGLFKEIFGKDIDFSQIKLDPKKDQDLIPFIIALLLYNSEKLSPFFFALHRNIALLKIFELLKDDELFAKIEGKLGISYQQIRELSMTFFGGIDVDYAWKEKSAKEKIIFKYFAKKKLKKTRKNIQKDKPRFEFIKNN